MRFEKTIIFLWTVLFFCGSRTVQAQNGLNVLEGPIHTMHCDSNCITLHADFPKPLRTNQYQASNIPFASEPLAGTVITLNDDKFSGAIPLGFSFCFFEQVFTHCYLSDNGILTFNASYAGGSCNNNTQQTLPYFNSTFPDNAICFPFMDLAPGLGGSIRYQTTGTVPFRKFVVSYQSMRLFGLSCSAATSTFQLVLYESSNLIDIHLHQKVLCDGSTLNHANYATIGIQNSGASSAVTAPGMHAAQFTANNQSIRFSPSGPPHYQLIWYNALNQVIATNVDSIQFCPPSIPYDKVRATLDLYCPSAQFRDSVLLTKDLPLFSAILEVKPTCSGLSNGSLTLIGTGSNPPFLYGLNGSPLGTNNVFTGLAAGFYYLSIQDALGCRKDTLIQLMNQSNVLILIDSIIKPTCPVHDGKIYVHATQGTPPYTYSWSTGAIGTSITGLGPGLYAVTVTDANGCTAIAYVNLVFQGLPQAVVSMDRPVCGDSSGSIHLTISGGNPPYQILWNTGATTPSITQLAAGIYQVNILDQLGCQLNTTIYLDDTLHVETDDTLIKHTSCNLSNGIAQVFPSAGLPPYSYSWWPGGQTSSLATGLAAGINICTTTDANGCLVKDTFIILPSLALLNQISVANANCDSSNGKIFLNAVLHASGPVDTLWNTGNTGSSLTGLSPGTYWVQTTDSLGCIRRDTLTIGDDGKPFLGVLSYTPPLCYGDSTGSVTLSGFSGTAPYKYSLDGINFSSIAQLNSIAGGTYTIYITDANSCLNDTTIFFDQPTAITQQIQSDSVVCFDDQNASIHTQAQGGYPPYQYALNNQPFSSLSFWSNLGMGMYTVYVKDVHGCLIQTVVPIVGPDTPLEAVIQHDDIPCFQTGTGKIRVVLQGGWLPYSYSWQDGGTGLVRDSLNELETVFTVIDSMGCTLDYPVSIRQLYCCKAVVPNAFSPNGDGLNDALPVIPVSEVSWFNFLIFDRWGNQVFHTRDRNTRWDGSFRNHPCDIGTYFYLLEYRCPFQKEKVVEKGDILLIR